MRFLIKTLFILLIFSQEIKGQINHKLQLKSNAPSEQDYFGDAIDTYDKYMVATCVHCENDSAYNGGFVNLYKLKDGNEMELISQFYPSISKSKDRLGQDAVAIYEHKIVVGDWMNSTFETGAAFVFEFDEKGNLKKEHILKPTSPINSFGRRVDIYKDEVAVSSRSAVFIYAKTDSKYQLIQTIKKEKEGFGSEIILKDGFLFVSAPYKGSSSVKGHGSVYVFTKDKIGKYIQQQELSGVSHQQVDLNYGESIDYQNGQLYVGVPKKNMAKILGAGMVDIYRKEDNLFKHKGELFAYDMGFNKYRFGERLKASDNFLAVGHAQNKNHKGSVYLFDITANQQKSLWKIVSPVSSTYGNDFGQNGIGIIGNMVFVGAPGDDFCSTDKEWGRGGCGSVFGYQVDAPKPRKHILLSEAEIKDTYIKSVLKSYNGDLVEEDYINQDGVFKLRNKKTKKWGLFQMENQLIPMEYDSLEFFGWNAPITRAIKNGKWGIIPSELKEYTGVPFEYDMVKILTHEGQYFVAAQKEGFWYWVDWKTGIEKPSEKVKYYQELLIPEEWLKK